MSGTASAEPIPVSRAAAATAASRGSRATSATSSTARSRDGPSATSSSRSATRACGPARPRLAASSSSPSAGRGDRRRPVHAEQLGDALDGGLERVRDGELGRRLHDHLEQRPRALELERELPRPLAGAQRVCGADAERREPRELLGLRLLARRMEQLEDAERRASQRQRRRDGAVPREPGGVRADRAGLGERPLGDFARRREIGGGLDAPRRGGDEPVLAALPEDRGRRPGDARGEPDDLDRGVFLVQRDRERLAGQLERRARERGGVAADREGAEDESGLRRAQLGGEPLLRAERLAGTEQLERDGVAVRAGRHEEELRGAGALGDATHRGGRAGEVVERRVRELRRRQHGSVELGRERARRGDGNRLEPLAAVVERANERDLGARDRLRGLGERPQRVGRARRPRCGRDRAHERRERRGSEAGVARVDVEQAGHRPKVFRPERRVSPRSAEAALLPDGAAAHRARRQRPTDDRSVAAVAAAELAGDAVPVTENSANPESSSGGAGGALGASTTPSI